MPNSHLALVHFPICIHSVVLKGIVHLLHLHLIHCHSHVDFLLLGDSCWVARINVPHALVELVEAPNVNRNCISVRNNVLHVVYMFDVYTSYLCSICLWHRIVKLEFYAVIYC